MDRNKEKILARIDHTLLKPCATREQLIALCEEALLYHTASVCIMPSEVKWARKAYPSLKICTVIGFPLGYQCVHLRLSLYKNGD